MKNLFSVILLFFTVFMVSCSDNESSAAERFADDMCEAMDVIKTDDTSSLAAAVDKMGKVLNNSDYEDVSVVKLDSIMALKCPQGFVKYKALMAVADKME